MAQRHLTLLILGGTALVVCLIGVVLWQGLSFENFPVESRRKSARLRRIGAIALSALLAWMVAAIVLYLLFLGALLLGVYSDHLLVVLLPLSIACWIVTGIGCFRWLHKYLKGDMAKT